MLRVLNKNNFKNLINSIDIPCDNKTRTIISNIFIHGLNITQNEISNIDNENKLGNDKIINKESLINEIEKADNSIKEILTLVLYKIVYQENFNVAPIEWLTAESLLNLIKFSHTCIFPVSGKNLFLRWCYVYSNNLETEIEDVKNQINSISLPAKILIYHEVIKWRTNEFKDTNFDLFLRFLSFLHEEEIHKLLLKDQEAI